MILKGCNECPCVIGFFENVTKGGDMAIIREHTITLQEKKVHFSKSKRHPVK